MISSKPSKPINEREIEQRYENEFNGLYLTRKNVKILIFYNIKLLTEIIKVIFYKKINRIVFKLISQFYNYFRSEKCMVAMKIVKFPHGKNWIKDIVTNRWV